MHARRRRRRRPLPAAALLLAAAAAASFAFVARGDLPLVPPSVAAAADPDPAVAAADGSASPPACERLPSTLSYPQGSAPSDASAVLRVVVDAINRDVTGVVDVEANWSGAEMHRRVGERIVRCTVTRLADAVAGDDGGGADGGAKGEGGEEGGRGDDGDGGGAEGQQQQRGERSVDELGREVVAQCFEVPFAVLDVDECALPPDDPMSHRCRPPARCVNTVGSYECLCPSASAAATAIVEGGDGIDWDAIREGETGGGRTPWERALDDPSKSTCPGRASTRGCCDDDGHAEEGARCRAAFRCPTDPCAGGSQPAEGDDRNRGRGKAAPPACADGAACHRSASPLSDPNFACECPPGLLGSGRPCPRGGRGRGPGPKVGYDGTTPTDETRRALAAGTICGCREATVDPCDGFPRCPGKHETCTVDASNAPRCACQRGFVRNPDYGCVDETPPVLRLRPDPVHGTDPRTGITRLTQGDRYEEHGVDVVDDNAEEYIRSLKIAYSRSLPQGCLLETGEFHVNYTVATPWTSPDHVRAKRTVVIDNVDECAVTAGTGVGADCPDLVAMCDVDAGAICRDEIGTYACRCPDGTEGDGFRPVSRFRPDGAGGYVGGRAPPGYRGGTGCRDNRRPVIELEGPDPKTFRVARPSAVRGATGAGGAKDGEARARERALLAEQRSAYEGDIRSLIKATSGAELCATTAKPNVRPTDCVRAHDRTYKGVVDLTSRVTVGEPVPKEGDGGSPLEWKVPYDVTDDAGNKAVTVWRTVVVEEVGIDDFERPSKAHDLRRQKEQVDRAVKEALTKDRRNRRSSNERDCPLCEPCNCNERQKQKQGILVEECNALCDRKVETTMATSSSGSSDGTICTPSYFAESKSSTSFNEIMRETLVFIEGLMGFGAMMLLLLGCTVAMGLHLLRRIIVVLFFGWGPTVQTYYHTQEDDEREKIMMQSVSYYRSPTSASTQGANTRQSPGSGSSSTTSGPRPPPTASMASQRTLNGGIFSPHERTRPNGTPQAQHFSSFSNSNSPFSNGNSPFSNGNGASNIYQSMSPITPLRNGGTPSASDSQASGGRQKSSPYNGY